MCSSLIAINPYGLQIPYVDLVLFWLLCAAQYPKPCQSLTVSYQPNFNLSNNLFKVHLVRSAFHRYTLIGTDCTEVLQRWLQRAVRKFSIQGWWLMMRDPIAWWCWYSPLDIYRSTINIYICKCKNVGFFMVLHEAVKFTFLIPAQIHCKMGKWQ